MAACVLTRSPARQAWLVACWWVAAASSSPAWRWWSEGASQLEGFLHVTRPQSRAHAGIARSSAHVLPAGGTPATADLQTRATNEEASPAPLDCHTICEASINHLSLHFPLSPETHLERHGHSSLSSPIPPYIQHRRGCVSVNKVRARHEGQPAGGTVGAVGSCCRRRRCG